MNIHIMSRAKAIAYSHQPHSETVAVISISDYDKESPVLISNSNNGIAAHCKVKFNDVEHGENKCITENDALKIVLFVMKNAKLIDKLIVHCEAGVSRSAGVAAAIMKAVNGDDWGVFDNSRYVYVSPVEPKSRPLNSSGA